MSNYYLVARNVDTNKVSVLELNRKWYFKNSNDFYSRSNSLEAIDLVTTRFNSKEDMINQMVSHGYINGYNYDFFIASKYKRGKEEKIKIQEVIYNTNKDRVDGLRNVAYESLTKGLKQSTDNKTDNNILLFKFVNKMYYKKDYRKIVQEGLTGIPKVVIDLYKNIDTYDKAPHYIKQFHPNVMINYGVSRSIVDSLNRYDQLGNSISDHVKYYNRNVKDRALVKDKLLLICDKNYVPGLNINTNNNLIEGQISLFDNNKNNITKEEMLSYVMSSIKKIDYKSFSKENKKVYINDIYNFDMDEEQLKVINKGLPNSLLNNIYLYKFHKNKLESCTDNYWDANTLSEDIAADLRDIKYNLRKDEILNRAYNYFLVYNDIKKNNCEVESYQKRRNKK